MNTRQPAFFDIAHEGKVYHGKYEPAKSAIASIKYISKEDKEPLEIGDMDWKQEQKAKETKKKVLGKRLASGETVADLIKEGHGELVFEYGRLVANQKAYQIDALPPATDLPDVCGVWIVGPPRTGKSHYVRTECGYSPE